ncbi:unnamed protein product [Ceutorhynchus assimilis]|uniref:Uncharacterized protein n=1 Tax=Ceutorhynchus assimilis TaxID=467358 RepID=A0A9N9MUW9_9CUCU|nr:unnamed protein product [Ceutorhynchus assimilis]
MKILQEDTRQLYVPTSIRRIVIDAKRHTVYAERNSIMPVTLSKETGIIRSGYIKISGLHARWIARRKDLGIPVVEKHVFVPNQTSLTTKNAIRVNMQILLENLMSYKIKVAELIDDATRPESEPLGEIISDVLGDQPLIQPDIRVLSSLNLENVEDNSITTETKCNLVVGSNMLQRSQILHLAFGSTKEDGFFLSREHLDFKLDRKKDLNIISIFTNEKEKLIFFKKTKTICNNYSVVSKISKNPFLNNFFFCKIIVGHLYG